MFIYLRKSLVAVLCSALTLLVACSKDNNNDNDPEAQKKGMQLKTDAKFGAILTDSAGRTIYIFANDADGTATCSGGCETVWPVYYSASASTDANLNATEVGTITRADGKKQTTYKGYPVYYYKDDVAAGDVKGDGVGGIWFVAKPDYALMLANLQLTGLDGKQYLKNAVEGVGKTIYLTDDRGRTLYAFSPDKNLKNTFTTDAARNGIWPVYEGEIKSFPSAISKDIAAVIDVTTIGKKQLTFKGWPLYYFGQDAVRGNNKGVSVPTPGVWPVITLDKAAAPL